MPTPTKYDFLVKHTTKRGRTKSVDLYALYTFPVQRRQVRSFARELLRSSDDLVAKVQAASGAKRYTGTIGVEVSDNDVFVCSIEPQPVGTIRLQR